MSGLTKEEEFRLARLMQDMFRNAVKCCMEGDINGLNKAMESFLKEHEDGSVEEMICEFHSEGKTLIHVAASSGKFEILKNLLDRCSNLEKVVNLKDDHGFTPLINATISESNESMKHLLSLGADVNARNKDGASAAHFAAGDGNVSRLQILCDAGATTDFHSQSGTPLHWAAGKGRSAAIKFLIDHKKADVNEVSAEGIPPVLMAAVACCDLGTKYLVEAEADIGMIVSGNLTTLHICAEHNLIEAVKSIVNLPTGQKCCEIETDDGNKPIHLAAMSKHVEVIKVLLPHTTLAAEVIGKDDNETIAKLLDDAITRLAAWEAKHSDANPAIDSVSPHEMPSSMAFFDSVENPSKTEETEKRAEINKDLGNKFYKEKDFAKAIEMYTKAIEFNKYNANYWGNRSAAYLSMKNYEKALIDAEICRRLKPNWVKGCFRLAQARLGLGLFEDAAVAAFEGCKLEPNNQEIKSLMQLAVKKGQEDHQAKLQQQQAGKSVR